MDTLTARKHLAGSDNPVGRVLLTDLDLDDASGLTTSTLCAVTINVCIGLSVNYCSPNGTLCGDGTCNWGTNGCC
jgi:hypothetical protein